MFKPIPQLNPDDLIGRTVLLPPQENGERLRAKLTKKVFEEIEAQDGNRIPNINFILDIGCWIAQLNSPITAQLSLEQQ